VIQLNNVVLVGRLTKDPDLKYLTSGTPIATFTLAIDKDYKNKDGLITTNFIPCEIMGRPAEYFANDVKKGHLVSIKGSIRVDRYETPEGEKRNFTKMSCRQIQVI
jgi:single-strand DNA-binding protein